MPALGALDSVQMKVTRIKSCLSLKRFDILDHHRPVRKRHQPALPKKSENAIDMNGGQPERIGQILLSHGHLKTIVISHANTEQSGMKLAHKVGDAIGGIPAAYVGQPCSRYPFIDEACPPQGASERRAFRDFRH